MSQELATGIRDEAARRLERGEAVALPLPSPLAYCVMATTPAAMNEVKGRPHNQAVASWIPDATAILAEVSLDERDAALLPWLLHTEGLTVLVAPGAKQALRPQWQPSHRDGRLLLFGVRWAPLDDWLNAIASPLYVSSANRTGSPSAVIAAEARAQLPETTFVVDGDGLRDPSRKHGSTTMISLHNGSVEVVRNGIHDAAFASTQDWRDDLLSRAPNRA